MCVYVREREMNKMTDFIALKLIEGTALSVDAQACTFISEHICVRVCARM